MNMELSHKIKLRKLHNENSKRRDPIPTNSVVPAVSAPQDCLTSEAKELLELDDCIQRVTELQVRLLTRDGNRNVVNMNYTLWEALLAKLQSVPNLTGLAEKKEDVLPRVEVLMFWERELRARVVQKRSELQQRGLIEVLPALFVCGVEKEAAQRICSYS
jgi:hypothetical protein